MLEKSTKQFSVIIAFIAGYLYINVFCNIEFENNTILFLLFACTLIGWVLLVNKERVKESWIWFVTFWFNIISFVYLMNYDILPFQMARIWGNSILPLLCIHCYCVYWIMSVSNGLLKTESSKYFLVDCINGAIIIPFGHLFLLITDLFKVFKKEKAEKKDFLSYLYLFIAFVIAIVLFTFSVQLLSSVNPQFEKLFKGYLQLMRFEAFSFDYIQTFFIKVLLSIPVSSYLYGLIVGVHENKEDRKATNLASINRCLEMIQKIPSVFWNITLGIFNVMYIIFMVLQFNYLFSIIIHGTIMQGYTIAQYARTGFFELCKVMTINFLIIWIVFKSNKDQKISKPLAVGIMVESILLSITAFSKIYFYIMAYGFTPLRYQSIWFTTVLMFGCICVIYYLLRNKDCSKIWILFTGVTLAITILI